MNYAKANELTNVRPTTATQEAEADYVAEAIKAQARRERAVKFRFIAKHKNLDPSQIAGPIMGTENVNGKNITVCTSVSEAEVLKFQENQFLMFMFS